MITVISCRFIKSKLWPCFKTLTTALNDMTSVSCPSVTYVCPALFIFIFLFFPHFCPPFCFCHLLHSSLLVVLSCVSSSPLCHPSCFPPLRLSFSLILRLSSRSSSVISLRLPSCLPRFLPFILHSFQCHPPHSCFPTSSTSSNFPPSHHLSYFLFFLIHLSPPHPSLSLCLSTPPTSSSCLSR